MSFFKWCGNYFYYKKITCQQTSPPSASQYLSSDFHCLEFLLSSEPVVAPPYVKVVTGSSWLVKICIYIVVKKKLYTKLTYFDYHNKNVKYSDLKSTKMFLLYIYIYILWFSFARWLLFVLQMILRAYVKMLNLYIYIYIYIC